MRASRSLHLDGVVFGQKDTPSEVCTFSSKACLIGDKSPSHNVTDS